MSTITLREYHQLIDTLIEKNANEEAIFHCTNILTSYPKSAKTYQQLGQALLENKRYEDAENVFSMVLSVFPDDFLAHAGLSAIHEENREIDKSIWHMEQAFETQPSNQTIQDELRRLIGKRDGTEPSKIRLTRGALIRMYTKGELYQQAIAETQSALQAYPDRVDLKLLLARLLVLTDAHSEAKEICSDILTNNPFCYEANRIMFELSATASDAENFDPIYYQRLTELNPYYSFIETAAEKIEDVPDAKISLDKPEYFPAETDDSDTPEWASRIGIPWFEESDGQSVEREVFTIPDLQPVNDDIGEEPSLSIPFINENDNIGEENENIIEDGTNSPAEDLPEWISKSGWIRANDEEIAEISDETGESTTDIAPEIDASNAQPAEDLPDWLQSLSPTGSDAPQLFTSDGQESIPEAAIPPLPPEIISEFLSDDNVDTEYPQPPVPAEIADTRESLSGDPTKSSSDATLPISEDSISDLPDWLKDLDTSEFMVNIAEESQNSSDTVSGLEETPVELENTSYEAPDFIEELESSDLIAELDSVIEEDQPIAEDLTNVEIETVDITTEPETAPLLAEEELPSPQVERDIQTSSEKTSIPSWVRNILANTSEETPVISSAPITDAETSSQDVGIFSKIEENTEEPIEELITDLPDSPDLDGAISEEVSGELDSWLNEMSNEEALDISAVATTEETSVSGKETADISLEALSDTISEEEYEPVTPEYDIEIEPAIETTELSSFDDRLSSMIGVEEEQVTSDHEKEDVDVQLSDITIPDLATLTQELKSGDYNALVKDLNKTDIQDEILDQLLPDLNSELEKNPGNFQLWQTLGDINMKRSNLSDALSAYREAEKNLLQ